jgi:hypothetical protein
MPSTVRISVNKPITVMKFPEKLMASFFPFFVTYSLKIGIKLTAMARRKWHRKKTRGTGWPSEKRLWPCRFRNSRQKPVPRRPISFPMRVMIITRLIVLTGLLLFSAMTNLLSSVCLINFCIYRICPKISTEFYFAENCSGRRKKRIRSKGNGQYIAQAGRAAG